MFTRPLAIEAGCVIAAGPNLYVAMTAPAADGSIVAVKLFTSPPTPAHRSDVHPDSWVDTALAGQPPGPMTIRCDARTLRDPGKMLVLGHISVRLLGELAKAIVKEREQVAAERRFDGIPFPLSFDYSRPMYDRGRRIGAANGR